MRDIQQNISSRGMIVRVKWDRRGFTLIEVLLSLGIFSILSLSIYSIFSNGLRFDRSADRLEKFNNEVRWLSETLTDDLENMVPFTDPANGRNILACDPGRLAFVRATEKGLVLVQYFLQEPQSTHIYKVVVGERKERLSAVTLEKGAQSRAQYLLRKMIPLGQYLEGQSRGEPLAEVSGEEEVLSMAAQPDSLAFSFALRSAQAGQESIIWGDSCSEKEKILQGVRLSVILELPPKGQFAFRKEVFIPVEYVSNGGDSHEPS